MSLVRSCSVALAIFVPFLCAIAIDVATAANTYVWTGAVNTTWTVSSNWSPTRSIPASDDVLRFQSGTFNVTGVPSQGIGQLVLDQANVTFTPAIQATKIIQLNGGAGTDLVVPAGSSISILGTLGLEIWVNTGATGLIAGNVDLDNGPHRLRSADPGGLVIASGGRVRTLSGYSGAVFGQTSLNSVVFQSGSTYEHGGGSNPFGAAAPNSVVIFEPGSLYRHKAPGTPSMSGRTYGNFELDAFSFTFQVIGGQGLNVDSIDVKHGVLLMQLTGPVNIRGSIRVGSDAGFRMGHPTLAAVYTLNGTTTQNLWIHHIDYPGNSSFDGEPGLTLRIDNPNGVQCPLMGPALSCKLEFVHGNLVIPPWPSGNPLFLWGTGDVIGASQSTGWVEGGEIWASVKPSAPSRLFPMGDHVSYAPLSLTYHALADSMLLTAVSLRPVGPAYYPYFTMAGIDSTQKADRATFLLERTLNPTGYTSFDVVYGWGPADVDPGADPNAFVGRVRNYGQPYYELFHDQSIGVRTATSIQMLGVTRQNNPNDQGYEFVAGEAATACLAARNASDFEDGAAAVSPGPQTAGAASLVFAVSLLPVSMSAVSVAYQVTDGTAQDGSDYTAVSGTLNFAPGDTVEYVTVPLSGDGTPERNETIQLALMNAVGATIVAPTATGTILDDDDVIAPTVTVIAPNGGEAYVAGSVVPLQWNATDDVAVASVTLRIKRDHPQPSILVATNVPNTGSYLWTSTTELTSTAKLLVTALDDRGNGGSDLSDGMWSLTDPTGVEPGGGLAFGLGKMAPNPVGAGMVGTIEYTLPHDAAVELTVIDVRGRRVATIESGDRAAGAHRATWSGGGLASGLYFVRLTAPGYEAVRRVVVGS